MSKLQKIFEDCIITTRCLVISMDRVVGGVIKSEIINDKQV